MAMRTGLADPSQDLWMHLDAWGQRYRFLLLVGGLLRELHVTHKQSHRDNYRIFFRNSRHNVVFGSILNYFSRKLQMDSL